MAIKVRIDLLSCKDKNTEFDKQVDIRNGGTTLPFTTFMYLIMESLVRSI